MLRLYNATPLAFVRGCLHVASSRQFDHVLSSMPLTWYSGLGSAADQPGGIELDDKRMQDMPGSTTVYIFIGLRIRSCTKSLSYLDVIETIHTQVVSARREQKRAYMLQHGFLSKFL